MPEPTHFALDAHVAEEQLRACVAQHEALLHELQAHIAREKACLYEYVSAAGGGAHSSVQQTHAQYDAVADTLEQRQGASQYTAFPETRYAEALVRMTDSAFADRAKCVGLRVLLEALLNSMWKRPHAPFVDTKDCAQEVVQYVRDAQVTESHPDDPRLLRLRAFHERLPDADVGVTMYS